MTPENIETVINTLADRLSVPANAIWNALIAGARFEILDSIIAFIVFLPSLIIMLHSINKLNKDGWDEPDNGGRIAVFSFSAVSSSVSLMFFIGELKEGIIGLMAPNVIAINKLISLIGR